MFWRSRAKKDPKATEEKPTLASEEIAAQTERVERLRRQLKNKDRKLADLQAQLLALSDTGVGVKPESIAWIFCTGRSGSTWLASMMGDLPGSVMWNEPLVGTLFGELYYVIAPHKRGGKFILGPPHREVWLGSIRRMVLEGATARYPELPGDGYLIIKEPHGSVGAPLLVDALPESRVVLLVRDPRDAIASALDGSKTGGWIDKRGRAQEKAEDQPDDFVESRARRYVLDVGNAKQAYESHVGPKTAVRYEDLRTNTVQEMRRICSELGMTVGEQELAKIVAKHSWEGIPEEEKGEGKFYRKATPGGWREDLTQEQVETVEKITAPILNEFYP